MKSWGEMVIQVGGLSVSFLRFNYMKGFRVSLVNGSGFQKRDLGSREN